MKSLFVVLLAVVAAESRQVCIPNSQFMQSCNTCFCNDDGTSMGCTFMLCDPNEWNLDGTRKQNPYEDNIRIVKRSYPTRQSVFGRECEPGTSVKHYCNTCACNKLGRISRCTKMFCDENVYNEDGTFKINGKDKCKPGEVYSRDGCNKCICNEHGTKSFCTNENCVSNLIETRADKEIKRWGPLYEQGESCTPGESFYSECNQCVCSRSGKSAFCTLMRC